MVGLLTTVELAVCDQGAADASKIRLQCAY